MKYLALTLFLGIALFCLQNENTVQGLAYYNPQSRIADLNLREILKARVKFCRFYFNSIVCLFFLFCYLKGLWKI